MIYLIISIVFLAATALCLADGTRRGFNVLTLNLVFRMTSGILGLVVLLSCVPLKDIPAAWSQVGGMAVAGGVCFWISGLAALQAVRTGHLGVTWTAKRCAMVIPTVASVVLWKEIPLWPVSNLLLLRLGGVGLIVTVAVLLAMDRLHPHPEDQSKSASSGWVAWLVTCVLTYGVYGIILRASASIQGEATRGAFMATVFVTAMILSCIAWAICRPVCGRGELIAGSVAGIAGFIGSGIRPWALRDLPGIVVFPVTAASVMVLVQLGGEFLHGHRLSLWGRLGIAVAIAAIFMLTLNA